jgi:hypothetical protein
MNKVNWSEQFKIRIANPDESFQKHEVIKLLLVMKLILKNKKDRAFLRIYTEQDLGEGKICDVYVENIRNKTAYAYEIQKSVTKEWQEKTLNKYKDWEVYGMNSSDLIIIPIKQAPDSISELSKWLEKFVF